jgi:hypothetical protein
MERACVELVLTLMLHKIAGNFRQTLVEQGLQPDCWNFQELTFCDYLVIPPRAGMTKEVLDRSFCNVGINSDFEKNMPGKQEVCSH